MNNYAVLSACYAIALVAAVAVSALREVSPSADSAQAAFELSEPRWNWAGWRKEGLLRCVDRDVELGAFSNQRRVLLRECRAMLPERDGMFGADRSKLIVFVCSPEACTWVLEP